MKQLTTTVTSNKNEEVKRRTQRFPLRDTPSVVPLFITFCHSSVPFLCPFCLSNSSKHHISSTLALHRLCSHSSPCPLPPLLAIVALGTVKSHRYEYNMSLFFLLGDDGAWGQSRTISHQSDIQ